MLYLNGDFIGAGQSNQIVNHDFGITHYYNSNGHRTKDLKDLDNDYILSLGCSHTEGVGLELNETYSHRISQSLNLDYYNMGVGGSGCDVAFYNLMTFLSKQKNKPKIIVFQWSFHLRFARFSTEKNDGLHVQSEGSWSTSAPSEFAILGERIQYFKFRTHMYHNIVNLLDIPVVHVTFEEYHNKIVTNYVKVAAIPNDKAKDNVHLGPLSHKELSENILKKIKQDRLL